MWHEFIFPLLYGLVIFIVGMKTMEFALHLWAGQHLERLIRLTTHTPFRGLLCGASLSALLQSSSAITVITIGLVNSGLLSFANTLGIILGTNIGTCMTTEIISFDLQKMGIPLLAGALIFWLLTYMFTRHKTRLSTLHYIPLAAVGLALVFIGISNMQSIAPALQSGGDLAWIIEHARHHLLLGILVGAFFSALIHSSAATISMTMGLASLNVIALNLGIALVLGANIGTCSTALVASIGGNRSGKFVAWAHVILNIGGVLLFYPFIPLLESTIIGLSDNPSTQVAHVQTVFNVICSVIALPLCYLPIWKRISHV